MSWKLKNDGELMEVRKQYGITLTKLMEEDEKIVIGDADLASSSGASYLYETYRDRAIDYGISEQNMISASAGMSLLGFKPFVHSFAPFVSRRVMDQIYVSAGFAQGNLHIYASDPGYWSQYNGATHTTFEDIAIARSIPNITVVAPSDAVSFAWVLEDYAKNGGVYYNRCTRKPVPQIYEADSTFEYGKSQLLVHGSDIAIIAVGDTVYDSLNVSKRLKKIGISCCVVDLLFIKPLDEELIKKVAEQNKTIITVENHNVQGGVGEMISRVVTSNNLGNKVLNIAVNDRYGEVGTFDYLKEILGISEDKIYEKITEFIKEDIT